MIYFMAKYRYRKGVNEVKPTRGEAWGSRSSGRSRPAHHRDYLAHRASPTTPSREPLPADSLPVKVQGMMWAWSLEYPNGKKSINDPYVPPVGKPVKLLLTSTDVVHAFHIPEAKTMEDANLVPVTTMWFQFNKTGDFRAFCREYCGTLHSMMLATIKVVRCKRSSTSGSSSRARRRHMMQEAVAVQTPGYRASFKEWVLTTDHKKIAILHAVTSLVFFRSGGLDGHGHPARLTSPACSMSPDFYNYSPHGARSRPSPLVGHRLWGAFTNSLIPLMIAGRDVAFPGSTSSVTVSSFPPASSFSSRSFRSQNIKMMRTGYPPFSCTTAPGPRPSTCSSSG